MPWRPDATRVGATRTVLARLLSGVAIGAASAGAARAQLIDQYFQSSVPGFGQARGVTVLARPRPESQEPSVHLGGLTIRADLDEFAGYNSNVDALPGGPGSWVVTTEPSLTVNAEGPRGRAGAAFTLDDYRYLDLPQQNHTDWTASVGTTLALGRDELTLGYAHLDEHQVATELGAIASTTPVSFQSDDLRAAYELRVGRLLLRPSVEYETIRFGAATLGGRTLDEAAQDRDVLTAGVTATYPLAINRNLVLVVQDVQTDYRSPPPGQPDPSSSSLLLLGGLDYQFSGALRARLLAGVERRTFASGAFATMTTPILEAGVIWTPTGLTTVTASASRRIEEATTPGVGSFTYTDVRVVVDHELRHDVLLQARADLQTAEYAAGGNQASLGLGAGVTWLLGPRLRLRLDYDFLRQDAASGAVAPASAGAVPLATGAYRRNLVTLALHIAL